MQRAADQLVFNRVMALDKDLSLKMTSLKEFINAVCLSCKAFETCPLLKGKNDCEDSSILPCDTCPYRDNAAATEHQRSTEVT